MHSYEMPPQLTLLASAPGRERMERLANPPGYTGPDLMSWLKTRYCGNKPKGGLWTSTATPEDEYSCDWARGLATNALIQAAVPARDGLRWYRLTPVPPEGLKVYVVDGLIAAQAFDYDYTMGAVPGLDELRGRMGPMGRVITSRLTNWEHALADWDAVTLTEQGADVLAHYQMERGIDTSFAAWNAESTLWGGWKFTGVEAV